MFFKRNSRLYGIRPLANQINPVNKHFHSPKKFFCSDRFYVLIWRLLACYRLFFCAYQFIIQVMSVKFREERKSEMDIYWKKEFLISSTLHTVTYFTSWTFYNGRNLISMSVHIIKLWSLCIFVSRTFHIIVLSSLNNYHVLGFLSPELIKS